jgi:hypothetical protein
MVYPIEYMQGVMTFSAALIVIAGIMLSILVALAQLRRRSMIYWLMVSILLGILCIFASLLWFVETLPLTRTISFALLMAQIFSLYIPLSIWLFFGKAPWE